MNKINIFTDGASRGNPGLAGAGIVIYDGKIILDQFSKFLGKKTNNEAEYGAMILALEYLTDKKIKSANLFSDSEFLVKQMSGKYKVKSEKIIPLYKKAQILLKNLEVKFSWVRREDNTVADSLANKALDDLKNSKQKISKNVILNQNNIIQKSSTSKIQSLKLDKAFFGKINCLKIQMNQDNEIYFHMGILKVGSWSWDKVKMNENELGDIINILKKDEGKCSFYHSFETKKTQIWCNKSKLGFSIKIKDVSKNLSVGELEVLRIILEECIKIKSF